MWIKPGLNHVYWNPLVRQYMSFVEIAKKVSLVKLFQSYFHRNTYLKYIILKSCFDQPRGVHGYRVTNKKTKKTPPKLYWNHPIRLRLTLTIPPGDSAEETLTVEGLTKEDHGDPGQGRDRLSVGKRAGPFYGERKIALSCDWNGYYQKIKLAYFILLFISN